MDTLTNQKSDVLELLNKRELIRQSDLQKQKDNKASLSAHSEKLDIFEQTFNKKHDCIKTSIENSNSLLKNELQEHFNVIYKEILILQKYIAASNIFLRSYDVQKFQQQVQELNVEAKKLEEKLLPKKKFSFKSKIKAKPVIKPSEETSEVDSAKPLHKVIVFADNCGFSNKSNETITMQREQIFLKDVIFENLDNCTVELKGSPSTLQLNNLKNCKIFSGPVSTSIFADNCESCTLVIACQQLRLHSSKEVAIYLHVTSRAIMEDCTQINIAPYNWTYENIEQDFKKASLDFETNNWKCIDDFNWLNVDKASPNWSEIIEKDRVQNWLQ